MLPYNTSISIIFGLEPYNKFIIFVYGFVLTVLKLFSKRYKYRYKYI